MRPTTVDIPGAHRGMLFWTLIAGLSFPAVGLLSQGLPPLLLTALRFAIAALALAPLLWRQGEARPGLRGGALYAAMGLCIAFFFGAMFWAAQRTTSLSMAALYVSVPLLAYLLGRLAGVERRSSRLSATLVTGAVGALMLALAEARWQLHAASFGVGEAVYLAGCFASAAYPVLSKWGLGQQLLSPNAEVRAFWSLSAGGVLIGILGLSIERAQDLMRMTMTDFALLLYLGIFSSGVASWLSQRAMAVLALGSVTAYIYLLPFVSMLLLFVNQPEQMGLRWIPGSLLVIAAVVASSRWSAPLPAAMQASVCTQC